MATATALSPTLRSKLGSLARRIRLQRALRGGSWLVLVLAVSAGFGLLLDHFLIMPAIARMALLASWLVLGIGTAFWALLLPLSRRLTEESLAALIEERHPELLERLTSTVELADRADAYHGSEGFIDFLVKETEKRAGKLDFIEAAPDRHAGRVASWAACALVVVLGPGIIAPSHYADLWQRFLAPWNVAHVVVTYAMDVSPGDAIVASGQPLAFSVAVRPEGQTTTLPKSCSLVITQDDGEMTRFKMEANGSDQFSLNIAKDQIKQSFHYQVDADGALSLPYQITQIEPVTLEANSPKITMTPPEYAKTTFEPDTVMGLVDLFPLQYSRVNLACRFARPAVAAHIEWTPEKSAKDAGKKVNIPLHFSNGNTEAQATLPAAANGSWKLILEAEHGIRTDLPAHRLVVKPDAPPVFNKVSGGNELKVIKPYDPIPLDFTINDDVGVEAVQLEYTVNNGAPISEPIDLKGKGTQEAMGHYVFKMANKVQEGDEVRYRLRGQDNRRVPEANLEPNVTYYPDQGTWRVLKIAKEAEPLAKQEILAQRDEVNKKLEDIIADVKSELRGVDRVWQESKDKPTLGPDQVRDLQALSQENRSVENKLRELSQEASQTPALQRIADKVQDVADKEMRQTADALRETAKETKAPERNRDFDKASKQLRTGLERLESLLAANEQLARERLDQLRLEEIAEQQKMMAEEAANLAKLEPPDPSKADELKRRESDLAEEAKKLAQNNASLRKAMEDAKADQAKSLADKARDLAKAERDLNQAIRDSLEKDMKGRLADLAKKQQDLNDKAKRLAEESKPALDQAQADPFKPQEADKASEALQKDDAGEAMKHQEQFARDLDRLAAELDKANDKSHDPREAAAQLSSREKDLIKKLDQNKTKNDPQALKDLEQEQRAIQKAAEELSIPPEKLGLNQQRKMAVDKAAKAADALQNNEAKEARQQMVQVRDALQSLSDKLSSLEDRKKQSLTDLEQLKKDQSEIAKDAQRELERFESSDLNSPKVRAAIGKQLGESARRQADVAERLSHLDTPNQEARKEKAQEALNKAMADLLDARPQDIAASQEEARRQLDRLEKALSGKKTAEEQARDLAKQEKDLAQQAARLADDPKATAEQKAVLEKKQEDIAKKTKDLDAGDAPVKQAEAARATRQAQEAAKADPTGALAQKKMNEAAKALDQLAKQMEGQDSPANRAKRLAQDQAQAADNAELMAKQNADQPVGDDAKDRQQAIADEAKQIEAGDNAQTEKKKALEALAKAQQAANQGDQAKAERQAADALQQLADKLDRQDEPKPDDQSPKQAARNLAKQQQELAQATQKAATEIGKLKGEPGRQAMQRAMANMRVQQEKLNALASKLPTDQAQKALENARGSMNAAEQALAQNQPGPARQKQNEAAAALNRLANQLPDQKPKPRANKAPATAQADPFQKQAEQARQLAEEQRNLREAVQKEAAALAKEDDKAQDNSLDKLAKQQEEIARQAADLAQSVQKDQGKNADAAQEAQRAAQSAQETSDQVQAGAIQRALRPGVQTARQLRDLAQRLDKMPKPKDQEASEPANQARGLADQQEDVNHQMESLANNAAAQKTRQAARQQDLQRQAGDLSQNLEKMAQKGDSPKAQQAAQQAADSARQARGSMRQAQDQGQQGQTGQANQSREQAAQSLDKAAQQAAQASQQMASGQEGSPSPSNGQQAAQSLQKAQGQMSQAQGQLGNGKPGQAQASMQQAAKNLQQAAQQLAQQQQGEPSQNAPGGVGPSAGTVDASLLKGDARKFAGKAWGELPGELRTQILQSARDKYGDNYAKRIKLYFEQVAETKN